MEFVLCYQDFFFFVLIFQTGTYWGKSLIFWHKVILAGVENLSLGLSVNNATFHWSSIHFDWRAFFMSLTSIYKRKRRANKGIMNRLVWQKLKDNQPGWLKEKNQPDKLKGKMGKMTSEWRVWQTRTNLKEQASRWDVLGNSGCFHPQATSIPNWSIWSSFLARGWGRLSWPTGPPGSVGR